MPKLEIDYSNTIIYKITCRDKTILDVYVGHTTNFVQRKHAHKQSCINQKSANHNCKLYEVIRNNGGWINWKMEIINFYNCHDHYEARKKEHEYFISLNATLNSIEPLPKPKLKQNLVPVELPIPVANDTTSKSTKYFQCKICDYITSRKSSYDKHLSTPKHLKANNANEMLMETCKKVQVHYKCECGVEYNHMSSLCRHKQKCNWTEPEKTQEVLATPITDASNNVISCDLVIELLKQNNEFRELLKDQNKQILDQNKQMLELVGKGIGNTTNNNSNNTTNKTKFNLNIFLNEQCKDAMNIMEFVNSLQLKLSDLERVGELGYVKGIGHIVINKLKALDVCKRPIHCSDLKRETMYVKDENAWEKENGKNEKITKMIKHVAHKNQLQINEWRQENPEHKNPESVKCDKFLAIVNQSMGGSTDDDDTNNYNKIIKNIAKEVVIDRDPE